MNNFELNSVVLNSFDSSINSSDSMTGEVFIYKDSVDNNAFVSVAKYKYLSDSLYTAQTQNANTPAVQCKIVDDEIQYSLAFDTPSWPLRGQSVVAPNGDILSIGIYGWIDGPLGFWKTEDASLAASWASDRAPDFEFEAAETFDLTGSTIAVSDYIGGSYVIDVYYLKSGDIIHRRSTDEGVSWSSEIVGSSTKTSGNVLAAMKPVALNNNASISAGVFYVYEETNSHDNIYYLYNDSVSWSSPVLWSEEVRTDDWIIRDIACYSEQTGTQRVYISGTREDIDRPVSPLYQNYNIYTVVLNEMYVDENKDTWIGPFFIVECLSTISENINNFYAPSITKINDFYYLCFYGEILARLSEDGSSSASGNYFYCLSRDAINFSLPQTFVNGSGGSIPYVINGTQCSLVNQSSYIYEITGETWELLNLTFIADISDDLISYDINEVTGSPSMINVVVGNQNGQWYGPNTTKTNADIIKKNKKVYLQQGYVNSSGVEEFCPKDMFLIDDIRQNVDVSHQDLVISGRNALKKHKSTSSQFSFTRNGSVFFCDIFSNTDLPDWTVLDGTWSAVVYGAGSPGYLTQTSMSAGTEYDILLSDKVSCGNFIINTEVNFTDIIYDTAAYTYIYPFYLDGDNWFRFELYSQSNTSPAETFYNLEYSKCVNGLITHVPLGLLGTYAAPQYIPIQIVCHNWRYYDFYIGEISTTERNEAAFDTVSHFGTYDAGQLASSWNVLLGSKNLIPTFTNFKLLQFGDYLTTRELSHYVSNKARIFEFNDQLVFFDDSFETGYVPGVPTLHNGYLEIDESEFKVRNTSTFENGEIEFDMTVSPVAVGTYGFEFMFGGQTTDDESSFDKIRFECTDGISSVSYIANGHVKSSSQFGEDIRMNQINLTGKHTYNLIFSSYNCSVYIDKKMVFSWIENESTFSAGFIGFKSLSNSIIRLYYVKSYYLYQQIERFSINPSDDLESSYRSIMSVSKSFWSTDLSGRLKSIVLNDNDPGDYTYEDLILNQKVDESDKEYFKKIIVIGYGVTAVETNETITGSLNQVRDKVIVDYKITTYVDAQKRALFELTNSTKYDNQTDLTHLNNVGSEIFDVITIVLPDSGTDSLYRVFSQNINFSVKENSISLGTSLLQ